MFHLICILFILLILLGIEISFSKTILFYYFMSNEHMQGEEVCVFVYKAHMPTTEDCFWRPICKA